ncbi:transcriptional regulator, HxlR family [Paraburkholderia steynii]|uniref:Transcriptional regulator, HxlR family n=1 Tax=Paraburkholderia steynii TaxID=1245441 RepID=A0A7Z7FJC5_9BURK|nr:helix-turn-helix domain-containing protein [Paraburkholderia steynii]SDI50023.1 transcriptional regulator, HxlR family [Paraburkholderia steynii]
MTDAIELAVAPFASSRQSCSMEQYVKVLSGAWTLRIFWVLLGGGACRFAEIARTIGDVSPKVLTSQLRVLERGGFIERRVIRAKTPHVEYKLTERGLAIESVFRAMEKVAEDLFPTTGKAE